MKKFVLTGIGIAVLLAVFYSAVYKNYYLTFYGNITADNKTEILVQGIPQNSAGLRGEYVIQKNSSIELYDNNKNSIDFSYLKVGDHVEILYVSRVNIWRLKNDTYSLKDGHEIPNVQSITINNQ